MITRFHIQNFKSLASFDLPPEGYELGQFTCLIGLNGSGKSTLLQAFDFVAHVVSGKVELWLEQRNWKASEVLTNLGKRTPVVEFKVSFEGPAGVTATWSARFNTHKLICTFEKIESMGKTVLELEAERLSFVGSDQVLTPPEKIDFVYKGSVLSGLKLEDKHPLLSLVKQNLEQLKSLELLSPQLLRKRAYAAKDIGVGGEKLSAFLAGMAGEKRTDLLKAIKRFYPHLENLTVKALRSGWKELRVVELYGESHIVQAAHMNDGLLRIVAILAQAHSSHSILLFDEIENGINPELVEMLVDFLIHCGKQIIVTTHSPMILNYIPDEIAKVGVILLYKTPLGESRSARFFDAPALRKKLNVLGPGEVFVDTRLTDLVHELQAGNNGLSDSAPSQ